MNDLNVSFENGHVQLKFSGLAIKGNEESIESVLEDIGPLISELLTTQLAWANLPEEEQHRMIKGHLALGMKVQAHIAITAQQSKLHRMVIEGHASIAELGFPEFSDDDDHAN